MSKYVNKYYLGSFQFSPDNFEEIQENHFDVKYCTFWEEHIFVSDHGDCPKVCMICDFTNWENTFCIW